MCILCDFFLSQCFLWLSENQLKTQCFFSDGWSNLLAFHKSHCNPLIRQLWRIVCSIYEIKEKVYIPRSIQWSRNLFIRIMPEIFQQRKSRNKYRDLPIVLNKLVSSTKVNGIQFVSYFCNCLKYWNHYAVNVMSIIFWVSRTLTYIIKNKICDLIHCLYL